MRRRAQGSPAGSSPVPGTPPPRSLLKTAFEPAWGGWVGGGEKRLQRLQRARGPQGWMVAGLQLHGMVGVHPSLPFLLLWLLASPGWGSHLAAWCLLDGFSHPHPCCPSSWWGLAPFFCLPPQEGRAPHGQKERTGSCFSKPASNGCCVWKGAQLLPVRPEPGKVSLRRAREIRHEQTALCRENGLLGVPLCTPSPHVHRSTSASLPHLYFSPDSLKTLWQGNLWLLAVSLGHLLPFPCWGKRVGKTRLILGKRMSMGSLGAALGHAAFPQWAAPGYPRELPISPGMRRSPRAMDGAGLAAILSVTRQDTEVCGRSGIYIL